MMNLYGSTQAGGDVESTVVISKSNKVRKRKKHKRRATKLHEHGVVGWL